MKPPATTLPARRGLTIANMGCKPDIATTAAMYDLYRGGQSCTQVAAVFGVTRQNVWDRLRRQGFKLRPCPRNLALPFIEFDGARYAPNKDNYFRKTTGDRSLLHWDIWQKANGRKIKRGWVVRFVDGDRMNHEADNLESVPKGEDRICKPVKLKACLYCGEIMMKRATGNSPEPPAAYAKRKTCNTTCAGKWKRGKRRGSRMSGPDSRARIGACDTPPSPCAPEPSRSRGDVRATVSHGSASGISLSQRTGGPARVSRSRTSKGPFPPGQYIGMINR